MAQRKLRDKTGRALGDRARQTRQRFLDATAKLLAERSILNISVTEIARDPLPPEEALRLVGLGERMDHFPSQLSGGEQQRVAIARAVAKRPNVLLCDEPTGALDVQTGIVVLDAIDRINRELGTTTAVITHNQVISHMADRVISISDGRIAGIERILHKQAASELQW